MYKAYSTVFGGGSQEVPEKGEKVSDPETLERAGRQLKEMDAELKESNAKLEDIKAQQEREQQSQDRENIQKKLQQEGKQLRNENLQQAVSLKKLLTTDKDLELVAYEGKKMGELGDLILGKKGQIYLFSENEKVIQAPSFDRIFAHPRKLHKELEKGLITICKLNDGSYYQPEHSVEVPPMIHTPEEGIVQAEHTTERYVEELKDMKRTNSMLNSKLAAMEKSVIDLANKVQEQDRIIDSTENMHDNVKSELERKNSEMEDILDNFDNMQNQMRRLSSEAGMWEQTAKGMYQTREEMAEKILNDMDKEEIDVAKEELQESIMLFQEYLQNQGTGGGNATQVSAEEIEDTGKEILGEAEE